jgi:hypothetical protein
MAEEIMLASDTSLEALEMRRRFDEDENEDGDEAFTFDDEDEDDEDDETDDDEEGDLDDVDDEEGEEFDDFDEEDER